MVHRFESYSCRQRRSNRLNTKDYINLILEKENKKQSDVVRKIRNQEGINIYRQDLNRCIKRELTPTWATRIEKAFGLKKDSLRKLVTKKKG